MLYFFFTSISSRNIDLATNTCTSFSFNFLYCFFSIIIQIIFIKSATSGNDPLLGKSAYEADLDRISIPSLRYFKGFVFFFLFTKTYFWFHVVSCPNNGRYTYTLYWLFINRRRKRGWNLTKLGPLKSLIMFFWFYLNWTSS